MLFFFFGGGIFRNFISTFVGLWHSIAVLYYVFNKCSVRNKRYENIVNTWCIQVLRSHKEAFAAAMQSWRERCEKCVCLQGDYVEK